MLSPLTALLLATLALADPGTSAVIRTTAGVRDCLLRDVAGRRFDLRGRTTFPNRCDSASFTVEDETGAVLVFLPDGGTNALVRAGDRVHVTGMTRNDGWDDVCAECHALEIVGPGAAPEPKSADVAALLAGRHDYESVRLCGIVRDAFRDEIDPLWYFLVLDCGSGTIYLSFFSQRDLEREIAALVGTEVVADGICTPSNPGYRRHLGRIFLVRGIDALRVLRPSGADPFRVPELGNLTHTSPADIAKLGRHRVRGRVIAVWNARNALVRTDDGRIVRLELASDEAPVYGDRVEAAGFPETDLFRINLTRAIWRRLPDAPMEPERVSAIPVRELLLDRTGRHRIQTYFHGRAMRMSGLVRSLPARVNGDGRLYMESEQCLVPVDVSARPDALDGVAVGCRIEVTGTYVVDVGNWRSNAAFPRAAGFVLVVRVPGDVRILSRPSWWTPARLLAVIGSLLAALGSILVWNASLRRLAERRGRQLFKAQIAQTASELKVGERTRLAVELHDAISQNLTGASMQIDAAQRLLELDRAKAARHLGFASRTLDSCREELRNCIWDLRNRALDERDVNDAIRRTLEGHVGEARLAVRFNVPRARLSDNTTNAILGIVRELATNAVRHGRATELRIAGSLEDGKLAFSVRDNGDGFDPANAPGMAQGHFGLQGIRERLKRLNGVLRLDSRAGQGTKAVVVLDVRPHDGKGREG